MNEPGSDPLAPCPRAGRSRVLKSRSQKRPASALRLPYFCRFAVQFMVNRPMPMSAVPFIVSPVTVAL